MKVQISVIGGSEAKEPTLAIAEQIGYALASAGAVTVTGGLGGVMAAACRGAKSAGIPVIGIGTWRLIRPDGESDTKMIRVNDPLEAAAEAFRLASP